MGLVIFTYMKGWFLWVLHVGTYTVRPMDPLGTSIFPAPSITFLGHRYPQGNQVTVMRTADVSPGARGAPLKLPIEHERLTTKNDGKHIHRYIFWIYVVSFSDFRSFHWMKFFKHERSFSKNLLQKPSNNNGRENACAYSNAQRYICKQ